MTNKKYIIIEPAMFKLDGGAMFGIIPRPMWNKVHPADNENRIDLALRLVLIQTDKKNILIDTGIGDYHGEKFEDRFAVTKGSHPIEKALNSIQLKTDDITDLIISHLHFDHAGGMTQIENDQMVPVFKNATLHLHKNHFEYAQNPTERDGGSFHRKYFMPVIEEYQKKNQLNLISGSEGEIIQGLKFKTSMGHTPYLMHAYDENFIYMADLIPTSNHVHIPWVMAYDMNPGVSTTDKRHFLEFIKEKNLTAIFEHDPKFIGSKILKDESGQYQCQNLIKSIDQKAFEIKFDSLN